MSGFNFQDDATDVGQGGSYLQESGVHIGNFTGVKYVAGTGWEAMDMYFVREDGKELKERYFAKVYEEADIDPNKTDDKWVGGVKQGKLNPREQVKRNYDDISVLLIQLAKASGFSFEDVVAKMGTVTTFKEIVEKFAASFNPKEGEIKKVNFGTYWFNSDNKQSSNLRLAQHRSNKLAVTKYEEGQPHGITFSDWEQKNMSRKYEYKKDGGTAPATTVGTAPQHTESKPTYSSSIFGNDD